MVKTCVISQSHGETLELIDSPVKTRKFPWGVTAFPGQGADGYGSKITMPYTVQYSGCLRRIFCTQISNAGSLWFMCKGKKIFVS